MAACLFRHCYDLGRDTVPVLNSFPVALTVATILGFLAGLGVGGGSLLMLWLTLVLQVSHPEGRVINLLFFIPSALIASFFRFRKGSLPLKKVLPAILAGLVSAVFFSLLSRKLELTIIKKLFGVLLLITGIRELFPKAKRSSTSES